MPSLVIFLMLLVTLTRSSYSISLSYSGSGEEECTIEPNECRPPQQRLLRNITELGLSLNESLPPLTQPPVLTTTYDPFIYMIELNELLPPSLGVNSYVLRKSSINFTSFEILGHQVNLKHNLSFVDFACLKVNLSVAWVVNETHSEFSPSVTLCIDSGVPGPVTNLTYEIEGRENCSKRNEAIITFNWTPPEDNNLLSHYMLLLVPDSTMNSSCLTSNESISSVDQNYSVILQFPCTYRASLISYPGAHSKQINITTIPDPSINFTCSSLFDPESMHYNVSVQLRVSPNNCLVLGHITTHVLKIFAYIRSFGNQRSGGQLDQKAIETDGVFQNLHEYTFTNREPRWPSKGYAIELQTKYRDISTDIAGTWSLTLSPADNCFSKLTPPIPPEKIETVNITNFSLSDKRIANFTVKWDQPLRPNGNITEYQIRVLGRNINLIDPIKIIDDDIQEHNISFLLRIAFTEISVQVRSTNNWCQQLSQCYSDWSDPVTRQAVVLSPSSSSSTTPSSSTPSVTGTPVDDIDKAVPFSLLWLLIGAGVLSLILIVVIAIIAVVCCQHGWCCIKRDFPMDPPINIPESGIIPLLQIKRQVMDEWEIPREILDVRKDQTLGSGCFGEVFKGFLQKNYILTKRRLSHDHYLHSRRGSLPQETYPVAVKKLKSIADGKERSDFLKEIEVMKTVSSTDSDLRRFVVNMVGCCSREEPMLLVIEFVENGDLLNYLRRMKRKTQGNNSAPPPAPYLEPLGAYSLLEPKNDLDDEGFLTERNLLDFSRQIASGMEYLSSLGIIHRDLACRNVLVGKDKNLKISDFGLSRVVLSDMVYTLTNHGRLPLRWMALESIFQREFTTSSDVWSYGVALWEICTMGSFPYATMQEKELLKLLKKGYRLPKPQNCSQDMFEVMHQCWHPDPQGRPTFSNLHKLFDYFLSRHTQELYPYIDMDCNAPYTYDHLTHKSITDYKKDETEEEEILYIEDEEEVRETEDTNESESPKDLSTSGSNEKLLDESAQLSETQSQEESASLYDKLRVDHPFLVRMSGQKNGTHDPQTVLHDNYFEDYIEENIEDYCLRAFEEYNPIWLKKLSTITEASCEDYDENS